MKYFDIYSPNCAITYLSRYTDLHRTFSYIEITIVKFVVQHHTTTDFFIGTCCTTIHERVWSTIPSYSTLPTPHTLIPNQNVWSHEMRPSMTSLLLDVMLLFFPSLDYKSSSSQRKRFLRHFTSFVDGKAKFSFYSFSCLVELGESCSNLCYATM